MPGGDARLNETRSGHIDGRPLHGPCKAAALTSISLISLIAALGGATSAAAQEQEGEDRVVVTGSRIERTGFTAPTPVTVMDSELTDQLGVVNVGDTLRLLPQNSAFVTDTNVGLGNFNIGAQLANLRGLNPFFGTRTLTLVDTRRHVPTTNGGAVDVTAIPSMLVQRVETVTGGASAAYGSDAVAGVVNIILDHDLEGVKGQVDYGQTFRGDGEDIHGSIAAGTGFASGRGHVIAGAEYQKSDLIGDCSVVREWCATSYASATNSAYAAGNGFPQYVIGPNAKGINTTLTGVFPAFSFAGPAPAGLANMRFNDEGTALLDFDPGQFSAGGLFGSRLGGDGETATGNGGVGPYDATSIRPEVERYALYARADYDLTPDLNAFVEGSYSSRKAENVQFSIAASGELIRPDNAYLPASVAAGFGGAPFAAFNRTTNNLVRQRNNTSNDTYRALFGLEGSLFGSSNWSWDAYYQYGRNENEQRLHNLMVNDNSGAVPGTYDFFSWAVDAVRAPNGDIVCRQVLLGNPDAQGCVPLNLFGRDNANPAAIAYAFRTLPEDFVYDQNVVAANVTGDLFEGWGAGPIGAAAGFEYRSESGDVTHGGLPYYNQFALSYGEDYSGDVEVMEGYAELNVPLLRDVAVARLLQVDGALRFSHNKNTSGLTNDSKSVDMTSWKVSAIWDPVEWLRFRGTRSRDVRAAGFRDLYARQIANGGFFGSVNNPWNGGASEPARIVSGGNFALEPEKADTTTLGVVLSPTGGLNGLRLSADWYEVKIKDAIASGGLGANNIVDQCFTNGAFCEKIQGVPNGAGGYTDITDIDNGAVNLGGFEVHGVDFEAAYTTPVDRLFGGASGDINVRLIASYLYDMIVDPGLGGAVVDYAGQTGPTAAFGTFNTSPKWQANAFVTYTDGPFSATTQIQYIDDGVYNVLYTGPQDAGYDPTQPNSVSDNRVGSATYVTVSASYDIITNDNRSVEVFGVINNLFDKEPPVAPGGNGYPTNPVYFDTLGARFRAGVRFAF